MRGCDLQAALVPVRPQIRPPQQVLDRLRPQRPSEEEALPERAPLAVQGVAPHLQLDPLGHELEAEGVTQVDEAAEEVGPGRRR